MHFQRGKNLRALDRERRRLWKALRELPMLPLDPPVQKGWNRSFQLREDQRLLQTADRLESILSKINTVQWSWKADFKDRRRYRGKKIYVVRPQALKEFNEWEFRRQQFTEEERALFYAEHRVDHKGSFYVVYVFSEPWRFTLRVAPNIIDKVKARDAALESALQIVDDHLERNALEGRLSNLLGNRHRYREWKPKQQKVPNPLHNRSLVQVLTALKEEL